MEGNGQIIVISFTQHLITKPYKYAITIEPRRFECNGEFNYAKASSVCKNIFHGLKAGLEHNDDGNNYYVVLPESLDASEMCKWMNSLPYGKYRIYTLKTKKERRKRIQHNTFNSVEYTETVDVMETLELFIPAYDADLNGRDNLKNAIENGLRDIDDYHIYKDKYI